MRLTSGEWITPTVRLVRPLGSGGMSTLWVAADMRLHTQVAVKFLSPMLRDDPTARKRFKREGRLAAKIESPHLVQTYDQGELPDGTLFLVMEWLEGETLKARLKREHRMTPRDSASVVMQIARALNKAHAIGVIHRDIKPDNVFLLRSEHGVLVKLIDFGVAKRVVDRDSELSLVTATNETLGTPSYKSAEQLRSASQVDYRTDLWSLAVVGYLMLIGALPFDATEYPALCLSIVEGRFTPPSRYDPEWPAELDAWCARSFHVDIEARFRSAEESSTSFALALGPLGDHQPRGAPL
jgi:serine/threonine protein kinase